MSTIVMSPMTGAAKDWGCDVLGAPNLSGAEFLFVPLCRGRGRSPLLRGFGGGTKCAGHCVVYCSMHNIIAIMVCAYILMFCSFGYWKR